MLRKKYAWFNMGENMYINISEKAFKMYISNKRSIERFQLIMLLLTGNCHEEL